MNIGLTGLLGIAFIVLKLTDVIAWSWVWVLAPFWIPYFLAIIFVIVMMALRHNSFNKIK